MKILFASSEAYPLVKTGGLADVAGALPVALTQSGHDVRLIVPAYPQVLHTARDITLLTPLGELISEHPGQLLAARMPDSDLRLILVECPTLFERTGGPYSGADGMDWPDNHLRFAFFSMAAAMVAGGATGAGWSADILHANDWQTGLAPAYLRFLGAPNTRSVFTIHNMRYQGLFPPEVMAELELPRIAFNIEGLEFHGQLSMLKAGLAFADRITTVSPTYAEEILRPEFAYGMEGLLNARRRDLTGVLNGIDEAAWNPGTDRNLPETYGLDDLSGKAACKSALQRELGLAADPDAPLFSMVTRLTEQKGIDLVVSIIPQLVELGAQVAVLGAGDAHWEYVLRTLPVAADRMVARLGYDEALAHRFIAGADMFLMPSRFEPCGLTQMYAMRYGTLPVVRRTGGLADTVSEAGFIPARGSFGTGFLFDEASPEALFEAAAKGVDMFADKRAWRLAQSHAMQQDFSWARAADEYAWIYKVLAPHSAANEKKTRGEAA